MANENNQEIFDKYMSILYPNYAKMSPRRREEAEFRSMGTIRYFGDIDKIFPLMKETYPDLKDLDLVNIARIYSEMYERTSSIGVPTGRVLRGEDDMPVDEYNTRETSSAEQMNLIKMAVREYQEKSGKFAPKIHNFLAGVKNYDITEETAKKVLQMLESQKNLETKKHRDDSKER